MTHRSEPEVVQLMAQSTVDRDADLTRVVTAAVEAAAGLTSDLAAHGLAVADLAAYFTAYYRHVPQEDLQARAPRDLAAAALEHRRLASIRPAGAARVVVSTPDADRDGWGHGDTVVQVVTDDMPFLVDSVTAELTRRGRGIHQVVHPAFDVCRDDQGRLLAVREAFGGSREDESVPAAEADRTWGRESWMHVEVDREPDPTACQALATGLDQVLADVRAAVRDWPAMREAARELAQELRLGGPAGLGSEAAEAAELLRWLVDDHFTFLGYREYVLDERGGAFELVAREGTGLGLLRQDDRSDAADRSSGSFGRLPLDVRERAREPRVLILTKANSRSTVHRPAYLDYVGVKQFDAEGRVIGERRFLGLFSSVAYLESVLRVPVVAGKVRVVLERAGFPPDSHSGKDLLTVLETYPRDELFQISDDDLFATSMAVLHLAERRRTRLFLRRDDYGRYMSCLVYLPRDRYTTAVRLRMEQVLSDAFGAVAVDHSTRVTESVLARLHFVVRVEPGRELPDVDPDQLEARLVAASRSWDEDLLAELRAGGDDAEAVRLSSRWAGGFPEAYKEDFDGPSAVADLRRLESLREDPRGDDAIDLSLYRPKDDAAADHRLKLFRRSPITLSSVLPFFSNLGVEVVDERPYRLIGRGGETAWIYDFGLRFGVGSDRSPDEVAERGQELFTEAFEAAWSGRSESDGFDRLVLRAGLDWGQVVVLRAYARYLRQTGISFSQQYLERCLAGNVGITRQLVRLFEARFDPDLLADADARSETVAALVEEVEGSLEDVASLDEDRILRSFLALIRATVRTNGFQRGADGELKPYLALKLDPQALPDLPRPRPARELWVYSPRMEGVHLRFGDVARGGLRWSDRREDFRTEVLGLVKAQMVKNAVIVPTGAKGGFVAKQLPDPAGPGGREAWLAEGVACYRMFVSAMLDVTDNLVPDETSTEPGAQRVQPPERVVRHDGEDSYLVVAADKGTATFSDIANDVSAQYGFWLRDAFASGGSVGYDHKAMGITAKGAWESVKRHFREAGHDTQTQPFTVVGVGDMSGDVFGNGMLLSEQIRLVAAFDHRHIFLDPDPDPAISFAERRRLFELPRSSWADYDTSLISEGGGVHPRSAKSIPVTPQVARRLDLPADTTRITPADLMRAVLAAPADLLWNGGIGTYVKASTEAHGDAGDKANDTIRVNGADLRVAVVGEGGNLGLTQLGRIEAALHGVRINTDAIDNSAGVDCSDHEVNIKILLGQALDEGALDQAGRDALLASMTDEVGDLVLRDNYDQNVLLGNARVQGHMMLPVHRRFMRSLEKRGELDRELEFLPSDKELVRRDEEGVGLTSPEFAVLVAYAKLTLTRELGDTDLADDPWTTRDLRSYFPVPLVDRFAERLAAHPLRREIVTTAIVNDMVNRCGITFAFRAVEETGASAEQVARAYVVCRSVFDLSGYVEAVEKLDNVVTTSVQTDLYLDFRRLLDRAVRWFLSARPQRLDIAAEVERFRATVEQLSDSAPDLLVGAERRRWQARFTELTDAGVDEALARRAASVLDSYSLLDIAEIAAGTDVPAEQVAPLYFALSERYGLDGLLGTISGLPRSDRWQALARGALRDDLYSALAALTAVVLRSAPAQMSPAERIEHWERDNAGALSRARATLTEVRQLEHSELPAVSVALRTLRAVIRTSSAG